MILKNITPEIIEREYNTITIDLGDTTQAVLTSYGKSDGSDYHEITIKFVDTETGEKPVFDANGIGYHLWYATGRIWMSDEKTARAQATQAELKREGGYFAGEPTDNARSLAWELVRQIMGIVIDDSYLLIFLQAGAQKKAVSHIGRLQEQIMRLNSEYYDAIGELHTAVDSEGNLTGGTLSFPVWTMTRST